MDAMVTLAEQAGAGDFCEVRRLRAWMAACASKTDGRTGRWTDGQVNGRTGR